MVVKGDYKGQAAIVTEPVGKMAHVYFPMTDKQRTLNIASLQTDHHKLDDHPAFDKRGGGLLQEPGKTENSKQERTAERTTETMRKEICNIRYLPKEIDEAIVDLCTALRSAKIDPDKELIHHINTRLRSSKRQDM